MRQDGYTVITVILEDREGGGLCVSSNDLPGLILSGPDAQHVYGCIAPAIETLLGRKGLDVVAHAERPLQGLLGQSPPRKLDMHVLRL